MRKNNDAERGRRGDAGNCGEIAASPLPRVSASSSRLPTSDFVRNGYTLLEMLLVLVVLVAVAGIAWPRLERFYADRELKQSAQELRIKLTGMRFHAIDAAVIYQFRYEPGGRRFLMIPYELDGSQTEPAAASNVAGSYGSSPWNDVGELPEDIQFQIPDDQDSAAEKIGEQWLSGLSDAGELGSAAWSPPLLYHPDGSATDAQLEVVNSDRQAIRLSIRGLTAAVSLSPIYRREQQ